MTCSVDRHPRGLVASLGGGLASVLLHVALLSHALFGGWTHVTRRADSSGIESEDLVNAETAMTVMALDEPDEAAKSQESTGLVTSTLDSHKRLLAPVTLSHLVAATHINWPADEQLIATSSGESDPGRTLMLGRYVGQISARVERAWVRPRSAIESGRFVCNARITQGSDGTVLEIELQNCNGDGRWEASLARAIQAASPLPAPPDPDVFAGTLTLEFTAEQFAPGRDPEGFEAKSRIAME